MPSSDPSPLPTPTQLAELAEYVALPSISRDADPEVMARTAAWLAAKFVAADAVVRPTAGSPVVTGRVDGPPGAPTVLVYGHYDVQPTGDLAEWRTDPFTLTVLGDRAHGRGVTDDKGPVLVVLETLRGFLADGGRPPVTVKLLLEGEEEIGSPHLAEFVRANAEELACDLVISADGAQWRPTEPSLSLASKGLVGLDVEVHGAERDLHSGRYGGTVANPVHALAALLASLHDAQGRITVPGFLDGVTDPSPAERAAAAAVVWDEQDYAAELGLADVGTFGEAGYTTLERLWFRPTLEVNGVSAGGRYTVIPHVATAHLTCRLVAGQDPDAVADAVRTHLEGAAPPGVTVRVTVEPGPVAAYAIAPDHPAVIAATAALAEVYPDEAVLHARIGGTLPATVLFEQALGVKTLFFSFSIADELLHAPNEFWRLRRYGEGVRAWTALWNGLATGLVPVP